MSKRDEYHTKWLEVMRLLEPPENIVPSLGCSRRPVQLRNLTPISQISYHPEYTSTTPENALGASESTSLSFRMAWEHLGAPVKLTGVPGRFAYGFPAVLHFVDAALDTYRRFSGWEAGI